MTERKQKPEQIKFKKWYIGVFCANYLFQGITVSMFAVIVPIYLIILIQTAHATITASDISFLASIIMIPSAIKLIYGILGDKLSSKKYGRRRIWVFFPVVMAGLGWILIALIITAQNAIMVLVVAGFIINTGLMMGDTAIDGLVLDIAPKEQLGRIQGYTWGARSIGQIAGGPALAFLIVISPSITVKTTFIILGLLTMLSAALILFVTEPLLTFEVKIGAQVKAMFKTKKDYLTYGFAFFNSIIDGVVLLFISLFILIQLGMVESKGMDLELGTSDSSVYIAQANITLIIAAGIVLGAIIGGLITDFISRKHSTYFSVFLTVGGLFLMLIDTSLVGLLLIFAFITGAATGWRHSSYSAVVGEMSKYHPEMDATYFAWVNSLTNLGTVIGLTIAGIVFNMAGNYTSVFIVMALVQLLTLVPFAFMNPQHYEIKKRLTLEPKSAQ